MIKMSHQVGLPGKISVTANAETTDGELPVDAHAPHLVGDSDLHEAQTAVLGVKADSQDHPDAWSRPTDQKVGGSNPSGVRQRFPCQVSISFGRTSLPVAGPPIVMTILPRARPSIRSPIAVAASRSG
jgi:hypothetical protein